MPAVHQFLPTFARRDAIGAHALHVQRLLRGMGLESDIYAAGIQRSAGRQARPYRSFGRRRHDPQTFLLYQLSIGSPVATFLRSRPEPKLVNYHNITDASLFAPWEPHVAGECARGRRELVALAPEVELGIAVSAFNEGELREAGYAATAVAPVLVDLRAAAAEPPDPAVQARLEGDKAAGGSDWVFVGRIAPNKCQHDLVRALAVYRRLYDPRARLRLVGATGSHAYATAVERYAAALGLGGAVDLTGSVTPAALRAYYRSADVFVCLSEHEGFCVPVVEAMEGGVPVVAYASTALPETVGGAGLVLPSKDPVAVAAAVHRVLDDGALRAAMVEAGRRRAEGFSLASSERRFVEVMGKFLADRGMV